jgi:hypothetical protein
MGFQEIKIKSRSEKVDNFLGLFSLTVALKTNFGVHKFFLPKNFEKKVEL